MQFDIVTIFPDFFAGPLDYGIVRRARESNLIDVRVHDLRSFAHDRHRTVDDRPFGGGEGMVLKPEPLFEAVESLGNFGSDSRSAVVLLSASGKLFRQHVARQFAKLDRIVLLCGRYEGVDERVAEHLATDELCIGDFVLSGGELPAALVLDAVTRLIPGALGNEDSSVYESFSASAISEEELPNRTYTAISSGKQTHTASRDNSAGQNNRTDTNNQEGNDRGLLDHPHYTRPSEFRGWGVPEILLGGNHEQIRLWRQARAIEKTRRNRPELLSGVARSTDDP